MRHLVRLMRKFCDVFEITTGDLGTTVSLGMSLTPPPQTATEPHQPPQGPDEDR